MELILTAIGHLGRDCSVKHLDNGNCAITFPIATSEKYKDKQGNKHERTTWVDATIWRKSENIAIADYLKKGQLVKVTGMPSTRGWKSRNDAEVIHSALAIRVDHLLLLGSAKAVVASEENQTNTTAEPAVFTAATQEDDLPF